MCTQQQHLALFTREDISKGLSFRMSPIRGSFPDGLLKWWWQLQAASNIQGRNVGLLFYIIVQALADIL